MLEQPVMHLPVLLLIAAAEGGFRRLDGFRMDRLQREVAQDIAYLAGLDIVSIEPREGLTDVACAERALVVRELHDHDARGPRTLERIAVQLQHRQNGRGTRHVTALQEILDLPEVTLQR